MTGPRTPGTVVVTGVGCAGPALPEPSALLGAGPLPHGPQPAEVLGKRGLRYKDTATRWGLAAAKLAVDDAGLSERDNSAIGVVVSSNLGNLDTVCRVSAEIAADGVTSVSPMALPNASSNVIASSVAIWFGLRGPNLTFCNGETSGLDAVHWASRLIVAGRCSRVLVIGAETDNPTVRALRGSEDPLFDGAVALMLEGDSTARKRGARRRARIGRYTRSAGITECLAGLGDMTPELWLGTRDHGTTPDHLGAVRAHDVQSVLGQASGALGVAQCLAAVGWFSGADGDVLATAIGADASAALVLSGVAG